MKTTVDIPNIVFRQAKAEAARRGVPLKSVIEAALREYLDSATKKKKFRLKDGSFRGQGLQEGLTAGDWATIRGLIYEGRGG
jgi:hypothetical protein